MFVCVCNRVKESDIAHAVGQGASTFEDIQRMTMAGTCCGQCSHYAQQLVDDLVLSDLFYSAA